MISRSETIGGANDWFCPVERIFLQRGQWMRSGPDRHQVESGPAPIQDSEPGATPDLLNHFGQRGSELFCANEYVHFKFILS